MKFALSISVALLLAASPWQPATAQNNALVTQAVTALGGVDALRNLKSVTITGEAKFWEPGQSKVAGGEPKFTEDATFVKTWDVGSGSARIEWNRDHKYPDPVLKITYTEIATPAAGAVVEQQGAKGMSGVRLAAQLRELRRNSPVLLLRAIDDPKIVSAMGPQKLGNKSLPAVALTVGESKFTVMFDSKTHLPVAIRTRDDDNVQGDSNFDLVLDNWQTVNGVKVAYSRSYQVNGIEVAKFTYKDVKANPTIAADAFNIPDAAKATAQAPATGNVPYQWVLRRLGMSRFVDNNQPFLPPGGSFKLVELGPNVQHVQGGGANNLIVAMKDHLVVFDAPYGNEQSRMVIDLAKQKHPGKPIKYLVLTHHHMDHTGGTSAYAAEGATIVVAAPTKAYFDKALKNPHTIAMGGQKARGAAKIVEVKDTMTLKDDVSEIRLYNIPNPHADGYILGHVVKDNVVFVTDLISPRGQVDRTEGTLAVGAALKKYGISGATIAGGHGATAKQADIAPALGVELGSR